MQFKNSIRSVVIACLALVITGFASLPSPEQKPLITTCPLCLKQEKQWCM